MTWSLVACALALFACEAPAPTDLAGELRAATERSVRSWRFDRAGWDRTVVESYRGVYEDYVDAFDAAVPALVTQLARRGAITTRAHFAGDHRLTPGQAQARWAVPALFPSQVAELDGAPIDLVFVRDAGDWHAITGIDTILRARTRALVPTCAAYLAPTTAADCRDIGWMIADAALRTDHPGLERACRIAATVCPVGVDK